MQHCHYSTDFVYSTILEILMANICNSRYYFLNKRKKLIEKQGYCILNLVSLTFYIIVDTMTLEIKLEKKRKTEIL